MNDSILWLDVVDGLAGEGSVEEIKRCAGGGVVVLVKI